VLRRTRAILLYWFAALSVTGLVLTLRGECFSDAACQNSEDHLAIGLLVGCFLVFPFAVTKMIKRFPKG